MDQRNATPHLYEATTSKVLSPTNEFEVYFLNAHEISIKNKKELDMPLEAGEAASPGVLELRKRLSGFETEEGRLHGLGFQCVPTWPACAAFFPTPPARRHAGKLTRWWR
jgi:hypothetical protein